MQDSVMIQKFSEVWRALKNESVRGSVIIAAAEIEDQLEELLKNRFLLCCESSDSLFDGGNAPVGTMSSKIELAYRTGCIGPQLRKSLHILRKLRNDFAHLSQEISFDTQSVKDRTRNLLKLNSDFVELIWTGTRDDIFSVAGITEPPKCEDYFSDMLKNAGYRHTFEIWASAVAGSLAEKCSEIERLEVVGDA
ncbi:hypothetical protein PVT68_15670 [Microbulbifer bruguierae]|uniref:DUF4145 domain-containing protein n=1 Tax=Microbulbifer bruguierae TaxID=3029061 RepID=A0ABY8NBM7_9GAMM|nr:hypothetical protein [Microbulbifer bruguierae]WGL16198.1 hypothetical protein PVT68_15670 [Microbulbifer bruguierae]